MTLRVTAAEIVADAEADGRPGLLVKASSWARIPLGDVGRVVNGAPFDSSCFNVEQRGMPLVRIRDIGARKVSTWYDGEWNELHRVRRGDLLIGMDGNFTVDRWRLDDAVLNQRVCRVDVDEQRMDSRFLELTLQGYLDAIWDRTSSTTVKHLSSKTVAQIPLPDPPLDEQRRIVEFLEEHLSSLDAGDRAVQVCRGRAVAMVDSYLSHSDAVASSTRVRLSELLAAPLANGRSVKDRVGGFPVLRLSAITRGVFDEAERKEGDWDAAEASRYVVSSDDFLCARGNGSRRLVGAGVLATTTSVPIAFPDTMIRIRLDRSRVDPSYFAAVWGSGEVRQQIESCAKTTAGIYKVAQSDLADVRLPMPNLSIQRDIAAQLVRIGDAVDQFLIATDHAQVRSAALRRALLEAAFSGQLTGRTSDLDPAEGLVS